MRASKEKGPAINRRRYVLEILIAENFNRMIRAVDFVLRGST